MSPSTESGTVTECGSILSAKAGYCGSERKKRTVRKSKKACPCGPKKSHRKRVKSKKKCMRPGPSTRNPFLNFLRVFRKQHCDWSITKIAIEGAKCWCKLSKEDKQKFIKEACRMQKSGKRRVKSRKRSRSRGRC
ncbi:unnamed protein product [Phyllotreta striolata]|uniref:Protamine n=1 Tax=Phyllotreta striolata TaxID=444603 RepID=A0A9N9TTQ1_PHYSR|nr:unnamed protein product [Phyllotreta striolata]